MTTSAAGNVLTIRFPDRMRDRAGGTKFNGPLHNQLPEPGERRPGYRQQHLLGAELHLGLYKKMIYSKTGVQAADPPDLNGGIDISGRTVRTTTSRCRRAATTRRHRLAVADAAALRGLVFRRHL